MNECIQVGGDSKPRGRQDKPTVTQTETWAISDADRAWLRAGLAVATVGWGAQEFIPMLLFYQERLGLSVTTVQATFVPYVVGLLPGLLLGGPFSDRYGRRRVMAPTMLVSAIATVLLILGAGGIGWILAGRFAAGVASGAGFSAGAAWMKELSAIGASTGANHGPRRLTVMMAVGFGLGPLVAGMLAQWAPLPTVLPYVPHLVLAIFAFALVLRTRETRTPSHSSLSQHFRLHEVHERRFLSVVVPQAPWVFIPVAIAVGYLPGLVTTQISSYPLIFSAVVTVAAAGAGILVQPVARRLDHPGTPHLLAMALTIVVVGTLVAALAAGTAKPALVIVASLMLGAGYGSCQVCGLLEVQRLARPGHLAGLTAVYQAVSYVGYIASYPLAAIGTVAPASITLIVVAGLAGLTLLWTTTRAATLTSASRHQAKDGHLAEQKALG